MSRPPSTPNTATTALAARLAALKAQAAQTGRPAGTPFGRWLGDFLTELTPHGLLRVEFDLLVACARGDACKPAVSAARPAIPLQAPLQAPVQAPMQAPAPAPAPAPAGAPAAPADLPSRLDEFRHAVRHNRVRAEFLRFLVLQGDVDAPVHEAGVQLYNAYIDCNSSLLAQSIDLRECKCGGRLALVNCFIDGRLTIEDGSLGLLILRGSWLAGIEGQRASISGTVFLDENFVSTGPIDFQGAEIVGTLQCTGATLRRLAAPADDGKPKPPDPNVTMLRLNRTKIGGSLLLIEQQLPGGQKQGFYCDGAISLLAAQIGGELNAASAVIAGALTGDRAKIGAQVNASQADIGGGLSLIGATIAANADLSLLKTKAGVKLQSAQIGGNLYFYGARIAGARTAAAAATGEDPVAIDAQNINVKGSFNFCGGFAARGAVDLSGAEIAKDLNASGSVFYNAAACALRADRAKISGSIALQSVGGNAFGAFGSVSLWGAACTDLDCRGARFKNPAFRRDPQAVALEGTAMAIAGSAVVSHDGVRSCQAFGRVSFNSATIGQHLDGKGGHFQNPGGVALDCQAVKISGWVSLGIGAGVNQAFPFTADGKVTFAAATIGLQMDCQSGRFRNVLKSPTNAYADDALDLSTATITGVIFLGAPRKASAIAQVPVYPPTIQGSLNLAGASVGILIDDGLVNDDPDNEAKRGLWRQVGPDGAKLQCVINLDLFTYARANGDDSCDSGLRKKWLERQASEDLGTSFKPQPFEQLVSVMRAMGYNSAADDIGERKRQLERTVESQRYRNDICAYVKHPAATPQPHAPLGALWGLIVNALEFVFIDLFIGYGYRMGRAVLLLFALCAASTLVDHFAFANGDIVPLDQKLRADGAAAGCKNWTLAGCKIADDVIPRFQSLVYSADVIVPVVSLGEKSVWTPRNGARWLYWLQIFETVCGWVGATLLAAFVTGLMSKE